MIKDHLANLATGIDDDATIAATADEIPAQISSGISSAIALWSRSSKSSPLTLRRRICCWSDAADTSANLWVPGG
jgi:hypothetical protein